MDIDALLDKADGNLTATRSFGPVVEREGTLVIPAAIVIGGGGGGSGEGPEDSPNAGKGGGAGHLGLSWPLGAYVVDERGVRWVPAFDATRVALAGLALARVAFGVQRRGRRRRRTLAREDCRRPVL
jgi:uncharacterized spore protein YtfJ